MACYITCHVGRSLHYITLAITLANHFPKIEVCCVCILGAQSKAATPFKLPPSSQIPLH